MFRCISCLALLLSALQAGVADECTVQKVANSCNDFGANLVETIGGEGNTVLSTFSICTALSMTYLGAGGDTATEMAEALQFTSNGIDGSVHTCFKELLELYQNRQTEYKLYMANALYLQQAFKVKPSYINAVKDQYNGSVKSVDFANNGEEVKDEINRWVAENTNNKIPKFLSEPLEPLTVLALLNAIYFKGDWESPFNSKSTFKGKFYKPNGQVKEVMFMDRPYPSFRFYECEQTGYKFLELPYKGDDIVMLLSLPTSINAFPDSKINSSLLSIIYNELRSQQLKKVNVPKFHLDFERKLIGDLKNLGITNLFDEADADLTGIRDEHDLYVSTVMHKAVIDVTEKGTEAAAVTAVGISTLSSRRGSFVANHPFLFHIIDKRNILVLFSGRVVDP